MLHQIGNYDVGLGKEGVESCTLIQVLYVPVGASGCVMLKLVLPSQSEGRPDQPVMILLNVMLCLLGGQGREKMYAFRGQSQTLCRW